MFYKPFVEPTADETRMLKVSRLFVIFWGVVLAVTAWQFFREPIRYCDSCFFHDNLYLGADVRFILVEYGGFSILCRWYWLQRSVEHCHRIIHQ